jgi:hypothetical protein
MKQNVKELLVLILILVAVRWAVHMFLPVFGGLVDPVCAVVFVLGLWRYIIEPFVR